LPWALPTALNAIVWRWLYNTDFGFFNNILYGFGFTAEKINWLGEIPLAMVSMMIVAIWKTSSFMALILLTGLQTIPSELYEAADIDGASSFYRFRSITLPLLVPSILLSLLFRSMDAFRAFELPFSLTQGGPAGSTQTLSLFGYRQFFQFLKFDQGAAVSVIQFIFIFVLGLIYLKSFRMET
ncbi:MAG: sugar ABC transporter permease, partial [Spirochaetia bacterium]|nr:sugar ABC transporter permease [Spirochaetia bacterium]